VSVRVHAPSDFISGKEPSYSSGERMVVPQVWFGRGKEVKHIWNYRESSPVL